MKRYCTAVLALLLCGVGSARADQSFADVADEVNTKLVKLFGSGGFKGLASYGTGVIIDPKGYILTVASPLLDTRDLRVHLYDGRRYHAKVIVVELKLDVALVKIDTKEELDLPYFDALAAAKKPLATVPSGVLAFSNAFQIATRDEPMSVQRGTLQAYSELRGRRGVHAAAFHGKVYIVDAITNNPGAAGGLLTTRKGEFLGLIGKELRNELSNTWINYATPIQTAMEVIEEGEKKRTISIAEIIEKKEKYIITKVDPTKKKEENYHGIVLVPDVVEFTPPFVEEVDADSPGFKAGLKPDDLIVYVDGEQVGNIKEFKAIIERIRPKTEVKIEVRRGEKLETLTMMMADPLVKKPEPKQDK